MGNIKNNIYNSVRKLVALYFPLFFQRYLEKYKESQLIRKYYTEVNSAISPDVVSMIDGKVKHGGLTDRINGIICSYRFAIENNRPFKILFNYPFNLTDYLIPNEEDWIIHDEGIFYNNHAKPIFIRSFNSKDDNKRARQLNEEIRKNQNKQLHIYTNLNAISNSEFQILFNRLFKPSERLTKLLKEEQQLVGTNYISASFRFQQLLGDFKEGNFETLSPKEATNLKKECKKTLIELYNKYPQKKILVTSDSYSFIEEIRELDFVRTVRGKVIHMEYTPINDFHSQAKAFVDLFMIANADFVHSIVIGKMYKSGFPEFASKIYNRPFSIISKNIDNN